MSIVSCDCVGGYLDVHARCSSEHCCGDEDTYPVVAFVDAWGTEWKKCGDCDGVGLLVIDGDPPFAAPVDEHLAVALIGGVL